MILWFVNDFTLKNLDKIIENLDSKALFYRMHAFLNGQCKNGLSIEPVCCDQNLNVVKGSEMEKLMCQLFLSFPFFQVCCSTLVVPDFRALVSFQCPRLIFCIIIKGHDESKTFKPY
jgi:hypothetical protein